MLVLLFLLLFNSNAHAKGPEARAIEELLAIGDTKAAAAKIETLESDAERRYWQGKRYFYQGEYGKAHAEMQGLLAGGRKEKELVVLDQYYVVLAEMAAGRGEYASEHFIVRAGPGDALLADYALEALEKAWVEIGADLECRPEEKVLVEIYPDREGFSLASTLPADLIEKTGTVGICKFNRLMILSPQGLPLGYPWLDTLAHEYTHYLVNRASRGKCPLWLHEGIARYHDTRWRLNPPLYLSPSGENELAKAVKGDKLVSFEKMHPSLVYLKDREEISLAFAEVSSAVATMKQEYGPASVAGLLRALAAVDEKHAFKKALRVSPRDFEKRWQASLAARSLREFPGVLNDQASFENKPEEEFLGADARGQVRLGDRMRTIGRSDAALIHYEKALLAEPANPVIMLKIARSYLSLGDAEKAKAQLEAAVAANPGYVTPWQMLGDLYLAQRNADKARQCYAESIAINPFVASVHFRLAQAWLLAGQKDKAKREFQNCLSLDPANTEAKLLLQRIP